MQGKKLETQEKHTKKSHLWGRKGERNGAEKSKLPNVTFKTSTSPRQHTFNALTQF